jgi:hypothetical protein
VTPRRRDARQHPWHADRTPASRAVRPAVRSRPHTGQWKKPISAGPIGVALVLLRLIGYGGLAPLLPSSGRASGAVPACPRSRRASDGTTHPDACDHSRCGDSTLCAPGLRGPTTGLGP